MCGIQERYVTIVRIAMSEVLLRQKQLIPDLSSTSALVVGLGGTGSWVAINLALLGVGIIFMFDGDVVEESNRGRTLFEQRHVGLLKTEAVSEMILARREGIILKSFPKYFLAEDIKDYTSIDYIYDCTDTSRLKKAIAQYRKGVTKFPMYVRTGYDGYYASLAFNNFKTGWGTDSSYQVIPSFFGTPQILSALAIINSILKPNGLEGVNVNFPINEIVPMLNRHRDEF